MSFLGILKKVMGSNSSSLKEPKFVKEFTTENKNILNLQELLKETKDEETANSIKHNINRLYYGLIGERNVDYELKNSHMPILILHNLYLEFNKKVNLLLGKNGQGKTNIVESIYMLSFGK